jgi:hypothetical protein
MGEKEIQHLTKERECFRDISLDGRIMLKDTGF